MSLSQIFLAWFHKTSASTYLYEIETCIATTVYED